MGSVDVEKEAKEEMSFLDHLEALRWHLFRAFTAIIAGAILLFLNKKIVFDSIIFAPKSDSFITFRLLCKLSDKLSLWFPYLLEKDTICIGSSMPQLQNIDMAGQFLTHITVSVVGGIIIAFPYVFWEIWRFISPALKSSEKRYTTGVVFFTSFLFMIGIVFGYYLIVPLSVNFLFTYQVSDQVITIPTLSSYISTLTTITLASGLVFELPLLVFFLTKMGLLTPQFMRKYRRHAIVAALILAAIITPPDVFSQILVAIPLWFLYEISIFISGYVLKKEKN